MPPLPTVWLGPRDPTVSVDVGEIRVVPDDADIVSAVPRVDVVEGSGDNRRAMVANVCSGR